MDKAVLFLNTLLGFGTALAPLLTALFIGYHFWWGLPLLLSVLLLALLIFCNTLPFMENEKEAKQGESLNFFGSSPRLLSFMELLRR